MVSHDIKGQFFALQKVTHLHMGVYIDFWVAENPYPFRIDRVW